MLLVDVNPYSLKGASCRVVTLFARLDDASDELGELERTTKWAGLPAINNLLCCPGLWRGTLDAQAHTINFDMYKAAAHAIAECTTEEEILPTTLDNRVHRAVTHAVARAALATGVARRKLDDDYFENHDILKAPWM